MNTTLGKLRQWATAYLFLLPALIPFALFVLWPLLHGIYLSLFDIGLREQKWIGAANYWRLWNDESFHYALRNTLFFVALVTPSVWASSLLIAAVVFPLGRFAQSFFRFAFYIPVVAGGVCLSMVWLWIFNYSYGLLNYLTFSVIGTRIDWLGNPHTALPSLAVVVISWTLGQPIIIFLAALGGIPPHLHEAAMLDGAGPLRRFWHITFPLLRPASLFVLVTQTIGVFQVFVVVLLLTINGGPAHSTRTIVYGMYETAFTPPYDFDYAAAQGVALLILLSGVAALQFRLLGREASAN